MSLSTPDSRRSYDELPTADVLASDCRALLGSNQRLEQARRRVLESPPSIHFEDFPGEVTKRDISVDEATARLAAALHLHLD